MRRMVTTDYCVKRIGRAVRVVLESGEEIKGRLTDVRGPWDVSIVVEPIPADGSDWMFLLTEVAHLYTSG